jgi:hypothetical protein
VPLETEPEVDVSVLGLSLDTLPEPAAPVPLETEPEVDVSVLGLSLGMLPEPAAPPLGAAVDGLLTPGEVVVDEPVVGEALGLLLLTAAWACRLHRSKSSCVGDADCPCATLPTASKLPAEINAATYLTVIIWSSSVGS